MKKLFSPTSLIILASLLSLLNFSCADTEKGKTEAVQKAGTGEGSNPAQKPDQNAIQRALKNGVLLQLKGVSRLSQVTIKQAKFSPEFMINSQTQSTFWSHLFELKIGETVNWTQAPEAVDLHDDQLTLGVYAKRISKGKSTSDLGYLVLQYMLQKTDSQTEQTDQSYLVMILDLNAVKNSKSSKDFLYKSEVIYPVAEFNLQDWIDKQVKTP